MKKFIHTLSVYIGLPICIYSQSAFTEEKTLWECPSDTSLKVTYRYSNFQNFFEINGPLYMDAGKLITGVLKITEGSFEEQKLTPQQKAEQIAGNKADQSPNVKEKQITINSNSYSKYFFYYYATKRPFLIFEGNCTSSNSNGANSKKEKTLLDAVGIDSSDLYKSCTMMTALQLPKNLAKEGVVCYISIEYEQKLSGCKEVAEILINPIDYWKGNVNNCIVGIQKIDKGIRKKDGVVLIDAYITISGIKSDVLKLINLISPDAGGTKDHFSKEEKEQKSDIIQPSRLD